MVSGATVAVPEGRGESIRLLTGGPLDEGLPGREAQVVAGPILHPLFTPGRPHPFGHLEAGTPDRRQFRTFALMFFGHEVILTLRLPYMAVRPVLGVRGIHPQAIMEAIEGPIGTGPTGSAVAGPVHRIFGRSTMDPQAVLALCHEHADAEARFDIDRILATLVPVPRYEFVPLGRSVEGWAPIERFYRHQYPQFVTTGAGHELLGKRRNEQAVLQEYVIDGRLEDQRTTIYHVTSIMSIDELSGLLIGERLYCDEGFVPALLGPLFDLLEPVDP